MIRDFLTYILLCCFLGSCAGGYRAYSIEPTYVINKMHVPFFYTAGQTELEASITQGFEFAGGYSLTDFLAGVASIRLKGHTFSSDIDSDSNNHQNHFFDLGAGYFIKNEDEQRLEAFVRIGNGHTSVIDQYDRTGFLNGDTTFRLGFFSYDYMKYSLQVNGGWEWKHWAFAGSIRGGYLHMSNINRLIKTLPDETVITNSNVTSEGTSFFDFAFTVRYMVNGWFGFELQGIYGTMGKVVGFESLQTSSAEQGMGSFSIVAKF